MKKCLTNLFLTATVAASLFSCKKDKGRGGPDSRMPVADFDYEIKGQTAFPVEVTFANKSANATTFRWDMGDGTEYLTENPRHPYMDGGIKKVRLIVGNSFGKDTIEKEITIMEGTPAPVEGTGDVTLLTDGNPETVYESGGANIAVVVPRTGGAKVAGYSLYSSGSAPQFDPASWSVLGSNDGSTWTPVETRSGQSFFARYQEHLFLLDAKAQYSFYKFEFRPSNGTMLKLAEIVFHQEDPNAGWENFSFPAIEYEDRAPQTSGSRYFNELVQDKTRYLQYHAREVAKLLYFNNNDQRHQLNTIAYRLEDYDGVSGKSGNPPGILITYSTRYISGVHNSSLYALQFETRGILYHEMTHAYQLEPRGIPSYHEPNTSWQIIEGMADAIRAHAGFLSFSRRKPGGYWTDGYQTTGFFLEWLTTKDPDALRKINASLREIPVWSFDAAMEYTFGPGTTTDELWNEYQVYLQSH